ncbi:MAG: hypothetical protein RLY70_187 [Planctomycetota bacterium]
MTPQGSFSQNAVRRSPTMLTRVSTLGRGLARRVAGLAARAATGVAVAGFTVAGFTVAGFTVAGFAVAGFAVAPSVVQAASPVVDWPSWRGPEALGSIDRGAYPVKFSSESHAWRTALPGKGCSTPIVYRESIYLTAPVGGQDAVLSFDGAGRERWRVVFGKEDAGKHRNGSGSNASPVTDGQAVFVYFKSGTLAAVGLDGKELWKTNLVEKYGKDTLFWDHGTSPVLTAKHVIMARMHQGESWLAAFDKADGKLAWKVARNYKTPVECDHGYSTPLVIRHQGREALLVWGAEHLTIHDAADGQMLWSCGGFNPDANKLWPAIATPVIVDGVAVVAYGRNDRGIPRLHGVRLDGTGDVTASNHLWKRDDVGTFVPSPLVHRGGILLVGDQGEVERVDPRTGKAVWKHQFPKNRAKFYASPLVAGDLLFAPREDGVVFVARVTAEGCETLAENNMGDSVIASPVPYGDGLLIRTEKHLVRANAAP